MKTDIFGDPGADVVLIQPVGSHEAGETADEAAAVARLCGRPFCLAAVRIDDWNAELSPWEAPAVFGKEGFGSGAGRTLEQILELCRDRRRTYYIGGYSLAGLFALWAACRTDVFSGVAAVSPSVWFPGFTDYMREHPVRTGAVYLSLGDREERSRSPVMASVGSRIREAHALLRERGVPCVLEWNEGGHFADPGQRTAKGFAWLLNR